MAVDRQTNPPPPVWPEEPTSVFRSEEVKALLLLPAGFHVVVDGVGSHWNTKERNVKS